MITFNDKFHLESDVRCSDKSLTHRALIAASIADGVSVLHNVTLSSDVLCTLTALKNTVARVRLEKTATNGNTVIVTPRMRNLPQKLTIDCGNSGTTARLLAGLFCGLGVKARFCGDESLSKRPMTRVVEPLRAMGADIAFAPDCLFETRGGKLHGATVESQVHSAQVKSAVILAGLFAEGQTRYVERRPTRNHTELLLGELGADVRVDGNTVVVQKSRPKAFEFAIPNDPSAVAYSVALALLTGQRAHFCNVLLNERRLGFYRVLQNSGATISYCNLHTVLGERVGDIIVEPSVLHPFFASEQDACDGIDEIPLLATMALFVGGTHVFCGVGELANKESNRLEAIARIANVCNKQCSFDGKNLTVISDGAVPKGKFFTSLDDHRIAMCETVLSVATGCGCVDSTPFEVSDPEFLKGLGIVPLKLGLVGTKVEDSLSPALHAHLAKQSGVCCIYKTVCLPKQTSDKVLLKEIEQFDGVNVTMPFKKRVASIFKSSLPSVNTVFNGGKNVTSTDGYGVVQSLRFHGIAFEGQPLWIVGAGGAAEAVICELLKYDCKLRVLNRTSTHAMSLQKKYSLPQTLQDPVGVLSFVPECDFEQSLTLPPSCKFVLIADYNGASGLRRQAEQRGLTVANGKEMLFHQGAKSFALWTGTPVQTDYNAFVKDMEDIK